MRGDGVRGEQCRMVEVVTLVHLIEGKGRQYTALLCHVKSFAHS